MSNEQITMYWGLHDLWGQGPRGQHGSKLKLAPLASTSLQLAPAHSQLTPAHSSLLPACSSLLPAHSSSLQLTPAHSQLTPAHFQLTPAHSQWPCMCWGPHHLWSVRGYGARWEQAGANWGAGASWSKLGNKLGVTWSNPSEWNIILGFRVPSTIGLRKLSAGSPCSQVASLAPRASLDPWSKLGASRSEQNVILGPWVTGTFLEPQEAPSLLPLLPACSSHSQLSPLAPRESLCPWSLWGSRGYGQGGSKLKLAPLPPSSLPSLQLTPSLLPALSSLPACSSLLPALSSLPACSS